MTKHRPWIVAALVSFVVPACGGDTAPLRVGRDEPPAGESGRGGFDMVPSGGAAGLAGAGSSRNPLSVDITDVAAMMIEIVTLSCAGECAEVQAVARGGNPPYAFAWNDGSTEAIRELCPTETSSFEVTATDTAIETDEFSYEGSSETARVTANVLECETDAGPPPLDGSVVPPEETCIDITALDPLGTAPWQRCPPSPELIHPTTGATLADCAQILAGDPRIDSYLRYASYDGAPTEQESLGGKLCAPLRAGQITQVSIAFTGAIGGGGELEFPSLDTTFDMELWGGSTPCDKGELLWSTSQVFFGSGIHCVMIDPARDHDYVHAVVRAAGPIGAVREGCLAPTFGDPAVDCTL